MAKRKLLSETIGVVSFDDMIGGAYPPAELFTVKIAPGQGVLLRGTILVDVNGSMFALGNAADIEANAILAQDIDTGTKNEVKTTAYRTGCFNMETLKKADGYSITQEDKMALRDAGIMIIDNPKNGSFSNSNTLGKLILGQSVL